MEMAGQVLSGIGSLIMVVGWIWALIIAFKHDIKWALVVLFCMGIGLLIYATQHFSKIKQQVYIFGGGFAIAMVGNIIIKAATAG